MHSRWNDQNLTERVETMEERLARGDSRMGAIERDMRDNTEATEEILEIVRMGKGFFKVLGHIGKFVRWALAIGAAVAAIVASIKSGHPPTP
jgi:hypothetical protein